MISSSRKISGFKRTKRKNSRLSSKNTTILYLNNQTNPSYPPSNDYLFFILFFSLLTYFYNLSFILLNISLSKTISLSSIYDLSSVGGMLHQKTWRWNVVSLVVRFHKVSFEQEPALDFQQLDVDLWYALWLILENSLQWYLLVCNHHISQTLAIQRQYFVLEHEIVP